MLQKKVLIHTAFQVEAQSFIDYYKLKQDNLVQNFKIFTNDDIVLLISGIGKKNSIESLSYIFSKYKFSKAFNIGIAGCLNESIKIGTLFCTNKFLPNINFGSITCVDKPLDLEDDIDIDTTLVDMESKYFLELSKNYCDDLYVFKVVSDHLDTKIPKKSFVIELINNSFQSIKRYI